MQGGGFIADDGPKLAIDGVVAKGNMHRAVPFAFVEFDGVPTDPLPPLKMNVLQWTPSMTDSPNPGIALG